MEGLSRIYQDNGARFDGLLGVGRSCDLVSRDYVIGGRRARLWVIDGYGKDATLERMGAFWLSLTAADVEPLTEMQARRLYTSDAGDDLSHVTRLYDGQLIKTQIKQD